VRGAGAAAGRDGAASRSNSVVVACWWCTRRSEIFFARRISDGL
jgi:hypothetical protein